MAITIKDIANKAGLSPASVSRILNNHGRFSAETAKKVHEIAESLGYFKNQSAADLSQKQSRVVGVLVPVAHTNFADEIIKGMQHTAYELNYELLITFIDTDEKKQIQTVQSLLSRKVFAIFMLAIDAPTALFELLNHANVQLVSISNQLNNKIPIISSNNDLMMHQIVDHLYQKGHRKIALIGSSERYPIVAKIRRKGYIDALAAKGITYNPDWIWGFQNTYQTGLDAIQHFGTPLPFTAAIGSADIISVGLLNAAQDAGLVVPNDISIVSVDGTELTQLTRPILTTIEQDFQMMGHLALSSLHEKTLTENAIIYTDTKIVLGHSVRDFNNY